MNKAKMDSLNKVMMGTAVNNLTRLDFSKKHGTLELDRLIKLPDSAFPLANVNLVLGVVTYGKLILVAEYTEEAVDTRTMEKMEGQVLEFLLKEVV